MKTKERSLIEFKKTWFGTRSMIINDKVEFFIMKGQAWGFGIEFDHYDRSLMVRILNVIAGVTVYHNE